MDTHTRLRNQRLMALFLAGCILFNYPLLSIVSQDNTLGGIPILYLYIFSVWIAFIGLMIVLVERT